MSEEEILLLLDMRLKPISDAIVHMDEVIDGLREEVVTLKSDLESANYHIGEHINAISTLKSDRNTQFYKIGDLENRLGYVESDVHSLQRSVSALEGSVRRGY